MPQSVIHFRSVVVFPSDVKAEKSSLPKIIDKINRDSANSQGLHLDLWAWDTDASPTFDPLGPQGSIDEVLRIDSCDLVIGIFWHRLGTPTADGRTGTEHELNLAYQTWLTRKKPEIMVYFLQTDYLPKNDEECQQIQNLLRFKNHFGSGHRLSWECKNKRHFEQEVERHLRKYVTDKASRLFAHRDSPQGGWSDVQTTVLRKEPDRIVNIPKLDAVLRDRALTLLKRPEFSEIRATLGESLGVRFLGHLLNKDVRDAEHLADGCGFTQERREHLLRVAEEALSYFSKVQRE